MKQIIQDLKKGDTLLEEVPVPSVKAGAVLIKKVILGHDKFPRNIFDSLRFKVTMANKFNNV